MLLIVLLVSAFGLVACGDDDGSSGSDDPSAILKETFGESKEVKSGRLDASVRINAQGLQGLDGPVTLALRGPFESQGGETLPKFDFALDITAGGQSFTAGAVSTGEKGYLKFMDETYAVPDQLFKQFKDGYAETAKCNEEGGEDKGGATLSALGIDPRRWLVDPSVEGEEEVGGAQTTHIVSRIDVPKFLDDVNRILGRTDLQSDPCAKEGEKPAAQPSNTRQLSEADRKKIADAIKGARVDVWTGADDRILRRLNVDLKVEGDKQQKGDVRLDLTIGALNEEQQIKEPTGAKPLEELTQQFGLELPGAISGSGSGGASGGSGSSGGQSGGANSSKYLDCVNSAGSDVAKLQQCADLIGQ
jgi:hypothetical protein